ncbi:dUTP diphosphatase [Sulfurimonas sp.]|uniref:dUTP diphosphatase n=1 Tax=Sulfurimonas sp. TaxID=2022749 RepID=UPI00261C9A85|nr:dUTP diphosphatase [Sulfurimonas sp.]
MNNKIFMMIELQNGLNDATNGKEWTKGITKNGKKIDWRRCIYMECAEMVDSFPWKHWKAITAEPDWQNHQIEVVDVWHFIISLAIEAYAQNDRGSLEDIAVQISNSDALYKIETEEESFAPMDDVLEKVENLIRVAISKEAVDLDTLFSDFFDLVAMSGLNLDSLYRLYVGKNILNQFRQDNGYKEGTYIKVWNDKEDNVVMKSIWETNSDVSPEFLYEELSKVYVTLV